MYEILTPIQMKAADNFTIKNKCDGITLMENAGKQVADFTRFHFKTAQKILVICGIGNNGGDGFITARLLAPVVEQLDVLIVGDQNKITGDAKTAFDQLPDKARLITQPDWQDYDLLIDAILGAGLDRDVQGEHLEIINCINMIDTDVLAIDLPSGIDGATGAILGTAVKATKTISFFRAKPAHYLLPARQLCGDISIVQIGIENDVLIHQNIETFHNIPALWRHHYPLKNKTGHKYSRGHVVAVSGDITMSGAARLMAQAALRAGAGLVTIASPDDALQAHAAQLTSIMLAKANDLDQFAKILNDPRITCVAIGPGLPTNAKTRQMVKLAIKAEKHIVLDAGGISAFANNSEELFDLIKKSNASVIMTPHQGEFNKLFPNLKTNQSKLEQARQAAQQSGAIMVFKGPDTVIAHPDNSAAISSNAPPWLATAGSGDVLTGIISGLVAQNMSAFFAASAGVWLHGDAANQIGPALISSDLDHGLKISINELLM